MHVTPKRLESPNRPHPTTYSNTDEYKECVTPHTTRTTTGTIIPAAPTKWRMKNA